MTITCTAAGVPVPELWHDLFLYFGMRRTELAPASIVATLICSAVSKGAFSYAILAGYLVPNASDAARFFTQVLGLLAGYRINGMFFAEVEMWKRARQQAAQVKASKYAAAIQGIQNQMKPDPHAFDRLVGVEHAVRAVLDALEFPIRYPDKVRRFNLKPARGILLYGPPGTGKTSLAKATAKYFGCYFASVTPAYLLDRWVGGSERKVSSLFQEARRRTASTGRPVILFFDEIDAIGRRRDGAHMNRPSDLVLNQLLAELDGIAPNSGVFVMAATNRLDVLDEALLRPGRFDRVIEVGLPDFAARKELFRKSLQNRPLAGDVNLDVVARYTEGRSPAVIVNICEQAAQIAARRSIQTGVEAITMQDLLEAVQRCREKPCA